MSPVEHSLIDNVVIPPRKSKAIPIVAPPSPPAIDSSKLAIVKALLNSFEGKSLHEQKQLLGDELFPLVKVGQTISCIYTFYSCIDMFRLLESSMHQRSQFAYWIPSN
jgi:hypothetical protein